MFGVWTSGSGNTPEGVVNSAWDGRREVKHLGSLEK